MPARIQFGVVILGAGASTRMGSPKLMLPWGSSSVVGSLVETWRRVGASQIAVVCAPDNHALFAEVARVASGLTERIINPEPIRGMFSSIQCAARWPRWRSDLSHWALCLGDQPHLYDSIYLELLKFANSTLTRIIQPSWNGRPRHPVVLPRAVFVDLATAPAGSLREFLAGHQTLLRTAEIHDQGLDLDIDTPADYEQALKLVCLSGQSA